MPLSAAGERARGAGVAQLPAIEVGGRAVLGTWLPGGGAGGPDRRAAMKANRAFHLIVTREGREPAFLADRGRLDRIEVVSVDEGEVVLYWDLPAKQATRLLKALREDLVGLDAEAFLARWEGADVTADWPL